MSCLSRERTGHVLGGADVDRVAATDISGGGVAADGLEATGHGGASDVGGP